jgi:polyketide biosynthesis enoyl-CoA hydratase PksH
MNYKTIKVSFDEPICFLQFNRPEANNTINELLVEECAHAISLCKENITIIVLEGLPDVFCFGADFSEINEKMKNNEPANPNPELMYDLWQKLAEGPFVTISHIKGKVNAGGVGFVAASDIVLADDTALFSLSELLFGLFPACVLPFLIRRIGFQKAHYMTLMTAPVSVRHAYEWGLLDAYDKDSKSLLRKHLLRLRRLSKKGISEYKSYMSRLYDFPIQSKYEAIKANKKILSDSGNLERICNYVEKGGL